MDLGIDDDELATCVACGLCLPHCPTYRVTGEEALSPRGRVAALRQVQWGGAPPDASFIRSVETCVQCRACETACPSGVLFGHLIEPARAALAEGPPQAGGPPGADASGVGPVGGAAPGARAGRSSGPGSGADHVSAPGAGAVGGAARAPGRTGPGPRRAAVRRPPLPVRAALRALRWHRVVLAGSTALAVAQRLRLVPAAVCRRLGLPARLPLRRPRLRPSGTDVVLFTGCVMDAWMREVHADVQRVVEAAGAGVALPGRGAACCGALALHAGLASEARAQAGRTMAALAGDVPILVDSAGCGAALRDYGRLIGTDEARAFSARVVDVHEWLVDHMEALRSAAPAGDDGDDGGGGGDDDGDGGGRGRHDGAEGGGDPPGARPVVAVQDPCHLRHVQRAHLAVRTVLSPFATLVELDDEGLCCGAGGAYAVAQPELAGAIRDRKVQAIARSGAPVVASANPGCALHLEAAGVTVVHPCTVVARALRAAPDRGPGEPLRARGRGGGTGAA